MAIDLSAAFHYLSRALLGLAFTLLPTIGPFFAVLLTLSQGFQLRRQDVIWLFSATVFLIPVVVHRSPADALLAAAPVLASWLIYRSFSFFPKLRSQQLNQAISVGMLAGLFLTVLFRWLQSVNLSLAYRSFAQAVSWSASPALYGHTIFTLGCAAALFIPRLNLRLAALAITSVGILASGNREAGIGWLIFCFALPLFDRTLQVKRQRARFMLALGILLLVLAPLGSLTGWGRTGFLVDVVPISLSENNLVQTSEFPQSFYWRSHGVQVKESAEEFPEGPLSVVTVEKTLSDPWLRLQQVIDIHTAQPYTASVWIKQPQADTRPGIQGWAELPNGRSMSVTATLVQGEWRVSSSGPISVLSSSVISTYADWQRYAFTFLYEGDQSPVQLFLGLAPDNRNVSGTSAVYAGFQLETGETATPYVPGSAVRGIPLGAGRLPFWQAAWNGFIEYPLFGNPEQFSEYYETQGRFRSRIQELPAHAHNQYLNILYGQGLTGLLAFAVLLLALIWPAINRRDYPSLLLLAVVLFINIFDTSFFYGGVLYPLVAVMGLRSATLYDASEREEHRFASFITNLVLASSTLLAPIGALLLVSVIHALRTASISTIFPSLAVLSTPAFLYASLLWPALAWREGLYPGYGASAPQRLKRQVTAGILASLVFIIVALQLPRVFPLSFTQLVLLTIFALLLLPLTQALARRILVRTSIWGNDIVILGAGLGGSRIARSLTSNPLIGYRPVAFFDDDLKKHGITIHGVPVLGTLDDAVTFAEERGINHAIIAIPSMPAELVGRFMDVTGRRFKRVQFVPDLPGMPAEDVSAGNLDGMLTIEFNNGLFSIANQTFKRLIDVLGALAGGALLVIPLFVIGLLIRLETKGPSLHRGKRLGKDGQLFECLKFRTMVHNADEVLVQLLAQNPDLRAEYELYHKLEDDPRITRIGRFLRRFSIDELPQLWNVLKGEMSLVGPRPYLDRELSVMGPAAEVILQAKPGITGLWQVSGRNELSFEERLELESHYVRNWTIWWDIIIIGQTVNALISRRGAK